MKHIFLLLAIISSCHTIFAGNTVTNIIKSGTLEELDLNESIIVSTDPYGTTLVDKWNLIAKSTSSGSGTISNEWAHSGNNALKIVLNNITARYHFFLAQEVKNVAPANYTFSFWVKPSIANVPIRVEASTASGDLITPKSFTPASTDWQYISVPIDLSAKSPNELTVVRFVIRMNCLSNGNVDKTNVPNTYFFDDFSCTGQIPDVTVFTPEPYLQSKTENSIIVNWFSAVGEEGTPTVEYGTTLLSSSASGDTKSVGASRWSEVKLTDLMPDTEYQYRCKINNNTSEIYKFRTLPSNSSQRKIRVLSFGDSHEAKSIQMVRENCIETLKELYNTELHNCIDFIAHTGDIVQGYGESETDFIDNYFQPNKKLSAALPTLIAAGNHDFEKNDSKHSYFYDFMNYTDISDATGDAKGKYFAQQVANSLFIYLNTNQPYLCDAASTNQTYQQNTAAQLDWLKNKLLYAENDNSIDMVFVFAHHGYRNEMWSDPSSNTAIDKIKERLYPVFENSTKIKEFQYGHTHAMERGILELKNGKSIVLFQNGNSGSYPDYFGRYNSYTDYPEIHRQSEFIGFAITEIDPQNKSYATTYYAVTQRRPVGSSTSTTYLRTYSPAKSEDVWGENLTASSPATPIVNRTHYNAENNQLSVSVSEMSDILSVHYQIKNRENNTWVVDTIIHKENIFGVTGYFTLPDGKTDLSKSYLPIDLNQGLQLNEFSTVIPAGNYSTRVRYRDTNYRWSEFSQEKTSASESILRDAPVFTLRDGVLEINSKGGKIELYATNGMLLTEKELQSGTERISTMGHTIVIVRFTNETTQIKEKITSL